VRQVLSKSEPEVASWRQAIADAVGANGSLVVDLIPQLEQLIGPQPPAGTLPPGEAQARFLAVFHRFVSVFALPEQPLVLFFDDMQWMDQGSLRLLEHLMVHAETRNLLLIGAYRDNEVDTAHPLVMTLETIRIRGPRPRPRWRRRARSCYRRGRCCPTTPGRPTTPRASA
jgi:predicted ATPase